MQATPFFLPADKGGHLFDPGAGKFGRGLGQLLQPLRPAKAVVAAGVGVGAEALDPPAGRVLPQMSVELVADAQAASALVHGEEGELGVKGAADRPVQGGQGLAVARPLPVPPAKRAVEEEGDGVAEGARGSPPVPPLPALAAVGAHNDPHRPALPQGHAGIALPQRAGEQVALPEVGGPFWAPCELVSLSGIDGNAAQRGAAGRLDAPAGDRLFSPFSQGGRVDRKKYT